MVSNPGYGKWGGEQAPSESLQEFWVHIRLQVAVSKVEVLLNPFRPKQLGGRVVNCGRVLDEWVVAFVEDDGGVCVMSSASHHNRDNQRRLT
jgi:hypothetical protein